MVLLPEPIFASPRQASEIFSLDGASPPRPKNLFFVRFTRANSETTTGSNVTTGSNGSTSSWLKDLSFLMKAVERPAVQPQTEELKQYNKTRVVYTGVKYAPVRLTIYDTADSLALQMWDEYSRHYFGTFRHAQNPNDFRYDVTTPTFNDAGGQGFGFSPLPETQSAMDDNSQFFFDRVSVYQVYGGEYVQYDLINPKISSFDPEDFNYEDSTHALINVTLTYEAIIYPNGNRPQPLSGAAGLVEGFADPRMDPGVVDYDDESGALFSALAQIQAFTNLATNALAGGVVETGEIAAALSDFSTSVSGTTLSSYGLYNFGSLQGGGTTLNSASLSSDLVRSALANPALAAALSIAATQVLSSQIGTLTAPYSQPGALSAAGTDVASGAVNAVGGAAGTPIADSVIAAVLAAASASGTTSREVVYPSAPGTVARSGENAAVIEKLREDLAALGVTLVDNSQTSLEAVQAPNTWSSANRTGMVLSPQAYAVLNAQRSTTSQIGYNSLTSSNK